VLSSYALGDPAVDNGADIPEAAAHILEPFYTTPGDTRFQVLLPRTQTG
jgi:hypothetical protein